jgi:hypothetical protein
MSQLRQRFELQHMARRHNVALRNRNTAIENDRHAAHARLIARIKPQKPVKAAKKKVKVAKKYYKRGFAKGYKKGVWVGFHMAKKSFHPHLPHNIAKKIHKFKERKPLSHFSDSTMRGFAQHLKDKNQINIQHLGDRKKLPNIAAALRERGITHFPNIITKKAMMSKNMSGAKFHMERLMRNRLL